MTRGIDDMIKDREASHGAFQDTAEIAQALKTTMRLTKNWETLPAESKEALEQAATQLSRILTGDAASAEHWNKAAASMRLRGLALGGGSDNLESDMARMARSGSHSARQMSEAKRKRAIYMGKSTRGKPAPCLGCGKVLDTAVGVARTFQATSRILI